MPQGLALAKLERQLRRYKKVDPDTGCWLWPRARTASGHGRMRGNFYVHRISAQLWLGFDPDGGLQVNHRCVNAHCYNPDHLYIGTQKENFHDALKAGTGKLASWSRRHMIQ